jgi:hypothetical protein
MYNLNREPFFTLFREAADPSNHAILAGSVVDANGQPLAATISVHKELTSPAWFHGNGTAPGGVTQTPDTLDTSMDGEPDGTFAYHVNPSRRPWLEGAEDEAYEVTISAEGKQPVTQTIAVSRGDAVNLGQIQLL